MLYYETKEICETLLGETLQSPGVRSNYSSTSRIILWPTYYLELSLLEAMGATPYSLRSLEVGSKVLGSAYRRIISLGYFSAYRHHTLQELIYRGQSASYCH